MIALLLLAAAAASPADAPNLERRAVMRGSMDIPDEIAPAVLPYLNCQIASSGVPVYADGRRLPPPAGIVKGSDCSAMRRQAATEADRMLRARGMASAARRRAIVDDTLARMDEFHRASLLPPVPPSKENDAQH
ncbi:MAG TPA: hypothetical protein VEA61_16155 [Allosphingosinicella sp.]|nr:hypothetical protein [Allosphingosinicella sp.]